MLKSLYVQIMASENISLTFSIEDIMGCTGLSRQSVINNISRLAKRDLIEKEYYRVPGKQGQHVRYKIKDGDVIEFIENYFM